MNNELHKMFCANVRRRRLELGLKQSDVALRLGVSQAQYNRIEGGSNVPTLRIVERVSQALDVQPAALLISRDAAEAI